MRTSLLLAVSCLVAVGFAGAQQPVPSPAEQHIAAARQRLAVDSKHPEPYTDLALALIRRARETGDAAWLSQAASTIDAGDRTAPGDVQVAKARVALLLAQEQWKLALAQAQALNKKDPDDVTVYGYLAQADLALGDTDAAEQAAQWMMNMRPNNVAALLIGADLRVRYNDVPGALDFLGQAYAETPPIEPEEQAWIANRMAEVELGNGQIEPAEKALARAESLFPQEPLWQKTRARLEMAKSAQHTGAPAAAATPRDAAPAAGLDPLASLAQPAPSAAPSELAAPPLKPDPGGVPTALLIPRPTETARAVKKYQALAAAHPEQPEAYTNLGAAYLQRARETGDVEDFALAEQALQKSLGLLSADLAAAAPLAAMAEVCMGEHRFADALDYAQRSLALGSGDLSAFAIVGDAYADMGEYEKAGIAYTRMQAAGSLSAPRAAYAQHARQAYLGWIGGDSAGAILGMETALAEALSARLTGENLAWLYYELGEFSFLAGGISQAADAYYTALTVYPGDYRALAGLAKVRAAQGKYDEAIRLYQAAVNVVPMPAYLEELGDTYTRAGQAAEAEKQYQLVEYIGRLGQINQVLHNRDLASYYANHDRKPADALTLARKEFEVRSDIYTWDALGWALYKNGNYADAAEASAHALRLGTRDPLLLFHSGMIAAKLGRADQARGRLDEALAINPRFHVLYADRAVEQLATLRKEATPGFHAEPPVGSKIGAGPAPAQ